MEAWGCAWGRRSLRPSGRRRAQAAARNFFDGFVGAVVGGFEAAVWPMLGVWPVVEAAVGERSAQALVEEEEEQGHLNPLGGEKVCVARAVALEESIALEFAQIVAKLVEAVSIGGQVEGSEDGLFLAECCKLRSGVLPADHHQGFWRQRYPDRITRGVAVCLRRRRHGLARSSFRSDHGMKRSRRGGAVNGPRSGSDWQVSFPTPSSSWRCCVLHGSASPRYPRCFGHCRQVSRREHRPPPASPRSTRSEIFLVSLVLTRWAI